MLPSVNLRGAFFQLLRRKVVAVKGEGGGAFFADEGVVAVVGKGLVVQQRFGLVEAFPDGRVALFQPLFVADQVRQVQPGDPPSVWLMMASADSYRSRASAYRSMAVSVTPMLLYSPARRPSPGERLASYMPRACS